MSEKKVVGISDLHMGSNVSPKPDNVGIGFQDENLIIPTGISKLHNYINPHWRWMGKKHSDADVVFILGDSVEGTDHQSEGYGCWTTDIDLQIDTAYELLKETFPKAVFYGVQGSKYHAKMNPSADKRLIAMLNDIDLRSSKSKKIGEYFGDDKEVSVDDINFYLRHAIGYSKKKELRSGAILREMVANELNQRHYDKFHYVLFGHTHYWIYVENNYNAGMVLPGWKSRDAFVKHRGMDVPDCGYVAFYIDGDHCTMEKDIWQLPKEFLISKSVFRSKKDVEEQPYRKSVFKSAKNVLKSSFN